jgi:hypothetical protein
MFTGFMTAFQRYARFWAMIVGLIALPGLAIAGPQKVALVVGNAAYMHMPGLTTATNDAQDMAARLRDMGYEVTLLTDIGSEVFRVVLDAFAAQAKEADTVVFYYAGHAFQRGGVNHLVPVSARLDAPDLLEQGTWKLDDIAARLKGGAGQVLIFLDACRSNPLPDAAQASDAEGLAQFDGGAGTFVAFATRPGAVAFDRPATGGERNSPFTAALLEDMATPGQSISDLMIGVRNSVDQATAGQQVPWDQSSLRAQVFLVPAVATVAAEPAPVAVTPDAGLPVFEFAQDTTVVGPLAQAVVAATSGVIRRVQGGDQMRLAAISSETRSLAAVPGGGGLRIKGVDAGAQTPDAVALPPVPATERELHAAIQTELVRTGCYTQRIDGDWGRGSQAALDRFHKETKTKPADGADPVLKPTEAAWRLLLEAPEKACKPQPAAVVTKKKPNKPAAPAQKKPAAVTKKVAPTPAPAPEKKGVTCKFMIVAVVCK